MTTHVTSVLIRSTISSRSFSKPKLISRTFAGSSPTWAKKSGIDHDEKPDNFFNPYSKKNTRTSDLTLERVNELSEISQNAFKLFKLNEKFDISTSSLQREMRNLQKLLHPDKMYEADRPIRNKAVNLSAIVNDYYAILKHPYKRAKYLLSIKLGKSQDEIEKDLDKLKIDDDFLDRMMDLRERLEDRKTDSHALARIESELSSDLNILLCELTKDFESKNMDLILPKLGRLKFLANCHHVVTDRMGSFSGF